MKNKVLGIWNYLLAGFLGFWNFAFMASSGMYYKSVSPGTSMTTSAEMYDLMVFDFNTAVSVATVFQLIMIFLSIAMLILALVQVMKLHGLKITFLDKVFEKTIKIKKELDIVTLLVFAYIFFSLLAMICLAIGASQSSVSFGPANYIKVSVGFGPVWLFLSSLIIAAKILFKDKVLLIMDKVLNKQNSKPAEKETKPAKATTAKEKKTAETTTAKPAEKTTSQKTEQKPAEKTTAKEQTPTEKNAPKQDNK